jgi:hypothetical protein
MKKYIFSDTKKQNLIESKQLMNIHQFSLTKFSNSSVKYLWNIEDYPSRISPHFGFYWSSCEKKIIETWKADGHRWHWTQNDEDTTFSQILKNKTWLNPNS